MVYRLRAMSKIILSVNAGSSSVKVSVYSSSERSSQTSTKKLAEGEVSGISSPPAKFKYIAHGQKSSIEISEDIKDQDTAFKYILDHLINDEKLHEIGRKEDINVAVHRVVHGGDYTKSQPIDASTMHHLEELTDLAPLHNATALNIVKTCVKELPETSNIAAFDSQFHQTIPEHVRTIPINQDIAKKNKLRKYGFHGISYAFIINSVAKFLDKEASSTSIIALHLGSGASACAIRNGRSVDTTMSLTPLDGLPGASRSGTVDPSLVFHYASNVGKLASSSTKDLHISRAEEILNKESGWKALTGTADFGDIAQSDTAEKKLAFDIMVDRISKVVGSYYVALEGACDALVFAGGIGEKSAELRKAVCARISCLGFELDQEKNSLEMKDEVQHIGKVSRKVILVCHTDEASQMVYELH